MFNIYKNRIIKREKKQKGVIDILHLFVHLA